MTNTYWLLQLYGYFSHSILYFGIDGDEIKSTKHKRFRNHPLKCVQWVVLLGGALGRMFGGSPQFLFVFYRPDRRENVRTFRGMVSST